VTHQHGPEGRRANARIEHRFVQVAHEHRVEALVGELARDRDRALVFVRTKRGADRLVKRLAAHGVRAAAMHGNKSQRQREQALARFESGTIDTLVATDVAARGIDVNGISHVINFDPPADSETYVHRIGRTGRAGSNGIGITLLTPDQRRDVTQLAAQLGLDHQLHGATPRRRAAESAPRVGPRGGTPSRRRGRRRENATRKLSDPHASRQGSAGVTTSVRRSGPIEPTH
jgi:superfamily II DNA/RNA helicase